MSASLLVPRIRALEQPELGPDLLFRINSLFSQIQGMTPTVKTSNPTFNLMIPPSAKPSRPTEAIDGALKLALDGLQAICVSPHSTSSGEILDVPSGRLNGLLADLHLAGYNVAQIEMRAQLAP